MGFGKDHIVRAHKIASDREFLFTYRFADAEWGISIFAKDATEAREKIKAVALARYDGEVEAKIPAKAGSGFLVRAICWWRNITWVLLCALLLAGCNEDSRCPQGTGYTWKCDAQGNCGCHSNPGGA